MVGGTVRWSSRTRATARRVSVSPDPRLTKRPKLTRLSQLEAENRKIQKFICGNPCVLRVW
jgi:hypothetical protein